MEWISRERKYRQEVERLRKSDAALEHPLRPLIVSVTRQLSSDKPSAQVEIPKSARTSWGGVDPLSAALSDVKLDNSAQHPLSRVDSVSKSKQNTPLDTPKECQDWQLRKIGILSKYTTNEKLSLKSSFLSGGNVAVGVRVVQNSSVADKVKHRLEQLDEFEEGSVREMQNLSQSEFVSRIEELNSALQDSWEQDQRVKALKIAIQCAKMLDDESVLNFYPSKFVLVTDILDNFGNLVFKRINSKAKGNASEVATETCKNWFFKIASIRELIPRLYVEACILKTYEFIVDESNRQREFCRALMRLTNMIRGIGDPLKATYARAYVCRIALQIAPFEKSVHNENLSDFLLSCSQFRSRSVTSLLNSQKLSFSTYLTLFVPCLDWILHCLCHDGHESLMVGVFNELRKISSAEEDKAIFSLVLNSVLSSFQANFIANRSQEFLTMVKGCVAAPSTTEIAHLPAHFLVRSLGSSLVAAQPIWASVDTTKKLVLLNDVWKIIAKLPIADYILSADVWIEFVVQNFGTREINTLLRDIVKHMNPGRSHEEHYETLLSIVRKLTKLESETCGALFATDSFMPFLDLFQKESVKLEACKIILTAFLDQSSRDGDEDLDVIDPVVINVLMQLCKTLHDSVNAISLEDERRQISAIVVSTLTMIVFDDLEAHLNFLVDSRANFPNLEAVIVFLIHRVNKLALQTQHETKSHTKKTTAFLRACLSYAFITIPSLDDYYCRLQLYASSAQVSLHCSCLPQTDAFLKAAITLLPQLPARVELGDGRTASNDAFFASYVRSLLSFILIVPDHPEHEPMYLFRGLFKVVRERAFESSSVTKTLLYMELLAFLSSAAQETYIYHIGNIDSNDTLYGNDEQFMVTLKSLSNDVMELILADLEKLGADKQTKRQSTLALEVFYRIVAYGDIHHMAKFALKLWNLAQKAQKLDPKQQAQAVAFVRKKRFSTKDEIFVELAERMSQVRKL